MKNIHVLTTDKPSRLWINNLLQGKLKLSKETLPYNTSLNIYITNDEEIKDGDWFIEPINKSVLKLKYKADKLIYSIFPTCKKIILTTDADLIKDGVQAIDDEFLEWFVKNPSCEELKIGIEIWNDGTFSYRIIIPKEENYERINQPISLSEVDKEELKQETLEELKKWKEEALISLEVNQKNIENLVAGRRFLYSKEEVLKAQKAILANIKDAFQDENYIINYLKQIK